MIDLKTNKFVIWGFKSSYNTFKHIQEAWYRALKFKFPDREVLWLDGQDNLDNIDFSNSLFLTVNVADLRLMPKRKDTFYVCHNTDEKVKELFGDIGSYDFMNYGVYTLTTNVDNDIKVGHDIYLSLQRHEKYSSTVLYWGTDLLPHEIEANKPTAQVFNQESRDVNFVGTIYGNVHNPFKKACLENGINFNAYGGYSGGTAVSVEENQWLVKASYMAPAIGDTYHNRDNVHYFPCRTAKNISYGCFPITNNIASKKIFPDLIFNEETRQLFYDAKEALPKIKIDTLHKLMDEVAQNHTYVTKLNGLLEAVRITQESR